VVVEDAGDDADDARRDVVGDDASGVEGIETFRSPGGLHRFEVSRQTVGIGDPHARAEDPGEVKGPEAEASKTGEEEVDAEDLGQVQGRLSGAGVLPDLQIPVGPVPDGGQHHQAGKDDVSSSNTLETPETGINTRFTGGAPSTPAAGHAEA
jgi:hypothetical protein